MARGGILRDLYRARVAARAGAVLVQRLEGSVPAAILRSQGRVLAVWPVLRRAGAGISVYPRAAAQAADSARRGVHVASHDRRGYRLYRGRSASIGSRRHHQAVRANPSAANLGDDLRRGGVSHASAVQFRLRAAVEFLPRALSPIGNEANWMLRSLIFVPLALVRPAQSLGDERPLRAAFAAVFERPISFIVWITSLSVPMLFAKLVVSSIVRPGDMSPLPYFGGHAALALFSVFNCAAFEMTTMHLLYNLRRRPVSYLTAVKPRLDRSHLAWSARPRKRSRR